MCDELKSYLKEDLIPFVESAREAFAQNGDEKRVADLTELLESFYEMIEDIDSGIMEMWECGELYDEFRRYRESGDFLDKIS